MNSPYWKEMEVQPSFKEWQSFFEGCLMCACDHGCNQWMAEQSCKTSLFMRIMSTKGNTSLDKLAQMEVKRANKIMWALMRRDCIKFNRELNEQKQKK